MPHDARPRYRLAPLLAVLFSVIAIVVLFFTGVAAQQLSSKQPVAAAEPTRSPTKPPARPGLGDKVRDGKFEFVVSRLDCARTRVGPEHLQRTAQGKYCLVSLSVRNISDGTRYFLGRAQKAYDATGTAYGDDTLAGVYANRDTQTFLEKLDPGERVTGRLVFDVPKKAKLTTIDLHDSPLSRGVKVELTSR
ncbi:DUF4352 domain-containing protein [Actinoplanes sp. TRM 88003]|uniref:DUF4352 domain-containing protein n=1 Tax=Paractinoplanes aksuensis TaxID=2939490 RepID=A0ABT1E126_9ACTN|nr:DUF4352 domain-containing protein [Actinoplanes aksuensis]MCO8276807.1 DUF4352 domain-containing protein [Actinoplanes aksuensis]